MSLSLYGLSIVWLLIVLTLILISNNYGHPDDISVFVIPLQFGDPHDECRNSASALSTSVEATEYECILQCFSQPLCTGYNWKISDNACELLAQSANDLANLNIETAYKYVAVRPTKSQEGAGR